MDQEAHWDTIGGNYGGEIFDVFRSDRNKVLEKYFKKHANPAAHAIDFGCGIGKAFPYLSPSFARVLAVDISSELLQIAKQTSFRNIDFRQADLARPGLKFPKTQFAFCCNVIMLPEIEKNLLMIRNISRSLHRGGKGLIVLPSLESIFYSSWRLIQWYGEEGVPVKKIPESELAYFKGSTRDIIRGIMYIDGVPTKHYSESEIHVLFQEADLEVTAVEKIEYAWNTEFTSPPSWMKAPYPWDWLIECRKL